MTNEEQTKAQKRNCYLSTVILAYLPTWTMPKAQPIRDLRKINITVKEAVTAIELLVSIELIRNKVYWQGKHVGATEIFHSPQKFREAIVLTPKGEERWQEINSDALLESWWRLQ